MRDHPASLAVSLFRAIRLTIHLLHGTFLATFYPVLSHDKQKRILRKWSMQILHILNIRIEIEGECAATENAGCLMIANHSSWLDIFVLNAIHPVRFIAKAEVRDWPLIGWLCQRSGTIFIKRTLRKDAAAINRQISTLLGQGICIGLFPEGTTTDGKQVGHFHSALIQPAIDAGAQICPIALRYCNEAKEPSLAAAFTGDMTLAASIWRILRCSRLCVSVAFTPSLSPLADNRRVLALTAQHAIAESLHKSSSHAHHFPEFHDILPYALPAAQSAYVLLLDPILHQIPK